MKNKNIAEEVFRYVLKVPDHEFAHLTIKMLAERFDVSRCHLSRTFHNERKMTLATFIHRQKLLRAERQLLRDQNPDRQGPGLEPGLRRLPVFHRPLQGTMGRVPRPLPQADRVI